MRYIAFMVLTLISFTGYASPYEAREDVQAFAQEFEAKHNMPAEEVIAILAQAKMQQSILDAISRPAERTLTWGDYKKIFVEPKRIKQGLEFWHKHQELIEAISQEYQVAPEIIVAIIGIETRYGRVMGSYRVIDALATLGFDYEPRGKFFRGQLEQYLLMTKEQGIDPLSLKGSYAGAIGYGQFIPGSYRAYAVDHNGDGVANIWSDEVDAIASVANYFKRHHWVQGGLIAVQIPEGEYDEAFITKNPKLVHTIAELKKAGVKVPAEISDDTKAVLMALKKGEKTEYWLTFHNFYVITRYNHSHLYGMAAFHFSQLLKAQMDLPQ